MAHAIVYAQTPRAWSTSGCTGLSSKNKQYGSLIRLSLSMTIFFWTQSLIFSPVFE